MFGSNKPCVPDLADVQLGLYNDSLTLLLLDNDSQCLALWVMKEMNWMKQLMSEPIIGVFWPLGFWKNDAIFLESENGRLYMILQSKK